MLLATDQDPMLVSALGLTSHRFLFRHGSKLQRGSFVLGQRCSSFVDELPLMSTAAGSDGYPVGQNCDKDHGMINLDVRTLTGEEFRLRVERSTRGAEVRKMVLDHLASQKWCQAGFGLHEAANFGAKCGGNSEIEVAPNFARTRPGRGRNSNLVLYLCANPIAVCMVLLNGVRNPWSRVFLGRGNTLDNRISCWPSPSSKKPYQFDFWW